MLGFYTLAYAVGFTPWERAGAAGGDDLALLIDEVEAERGGPGRALDLGCGSGMHLVTLARRGWTATGVDMVDRALARARERVSSSGVRADVVKADVTELPEGTVGTGYDFFLDLGCFHGLAPTDRARMGRAVTDRARPGASLLMLVFGKPAGPGFLGQHASPADIESAFGDWRTEEVRRVDVDRNAMPRMVQRAQPTMYLLRRRT